MNKNRISTASGIVIEKDCIKLPDELCIEFGLNPSDYVYILKTRVAYELYKYNPDTQNHNQPGSIRQLDDTYSCKLPDELLNNKKSSTGQRVICQLFHKNDVMLLSFLESISSIEEKLKGIFNAPLSALLL